MAKSAVVFVANGCEPVEVVAPVRGERVSRVGYTAKHSFHGAAGRRGPTAV